MENTSTIITELLNETTTLLASNSTTATTTTTSKEISFFNTTQKISKYIPTFFVKTDYCQTSHYKSFCNIIAILICIGYFLRLFIIPFIKIRIEKLKHQLRADYNFSIVWLWLISTIIFIDLVEFFAATNTEIYTRTITLFNTVTLVFSLYTISVYIYYYGFTKDNYKNYIASLFFVMLWLTLIILRSIIAAGERKQLMKTGTICFCNCTSI